MDAALEKTSVTGKLLACRIAGAISSFNFDKRANLIPATIHTSHIRKGHLFPKSFASKGDDTFYYLGPEKYDPPRLYLPHVGLRLGPLRPSLLEPRSLERPPGHFRGVGEGKYPSLFL